MDEFHPITLRLIIYGTAIRCFSIAVVFTILLRCEVIQLGPDPEVFSGFFSTFTLFAMFLVCPFIGSSVFATIWQRITPIRNKVTYFEDEIVFAGSAFIGISIALIMYDIKPINAFIAIVKTLILASPVSFAICFAKSKLNPIHKRDTKAVVEAIIEHQEDTPHMWRNYFACGLTGLTTAVTMQLALEIIPSFRAPIGELDLLVPSFMTLCILCMIITPWLVLFGNRLSPKNITSEGWHYFIGGTAMISLLNGVNYVLMSFATTKHVSLGAIYNSVDLLADGAAHLLIVCSYLLGGIVFSALYKADSISLQFR